MCYYIINDSLFYCGKDIRMRVISGIAKGKPLQTLSGGDTVRPTTDRVKEAIFSAIHFDLPGANVIDVFAGSGQMGIEALSRGAASAVFLDCSQNATKVIGKNLEYCNFSKLGKVLCTDYSAYLARQSESFDVAFIDPPYHLQIFNEAIAQIIPHISDNGIIVCEHPVSTTILDVASCSRRDYKYGKIAVTVFRKEAE